MIEFILYKCRVKIFSVFSDVQDPVDVWSGSSDLLSRIWELDLDFNPDPTPVENLPPVSMMPARNFSPASKTSTEIYFQCRQSRPPVFRNDDKDAMVEGERNGIMKKAYVDNLVLLSILGAVYNMYK